MKIRVRFRWKRKGDFAKLKRREENISTEKRRLMEEIERARKEAELERRRREVWNRELLNRPGGEHMKQPMPNGFEPSNRPEGEQTKVPGSIGYKTLTRPGGEQMNQQRPGGEPMELARPSNEQAQGQSPNGYITANKQDGKQMTRPSSELASRPSPNSYKQVNRPNRTKTAKKKIDRDKACRKVIDYGILGLLVFSPLPAASVYDWSILVIELTVFVMMAAYFLMREKPENNVLLSLLLKWPRYLFCGLFVLIFVQIIPWPKFMVSLFSPHTYTFQKLFSPDFSRIKFISFSLMPSYTIQEGLELLSYFLLGLLIIKTVTRQRQIKRIFYVLVVMGVFEAFYGLFELYNRNPRILFYKKIYDLDSVTGTFVNRNHLSGYLEMVIPLTIGLILARIDVVSLARLKWKEKIFRLFEKGAYTNLILALGIIVMALGIIFSKSRSGIFLLVLTFILFFELSALYFGRVRYHQKWIKSFLKVTFLIITFISLYVGIDAAIERFALDKLLQEQRPAAWANTVGIVSDFPVFGAGLGSFESLYPAYEEGRMTGRYYHAHNDYLEYLAELGAGGLILLLGGILFMLARAFLIWRERRNPEVKGLALGGMVAVLAILIHSITDFNLYIPANMLLFTVVLTVTMVVAFYRAGERNKNSETSNVKSEISNIRKTQNENKISARNEKSGIRSKTAEIKCNTSDVKHETTNTIRKMTDVRREVTDVRRKTQNEKSESSSIKRRDTVKKILLLAGLVIVGIVCIFIYLNKHLYYRAKKTEDNEEKVKVLERARQFYSLNDLVFHELGKAYFDLGIRNLDLDNALGDDYLQKSIRNFSRSLRLNPASYFTHFNYAKSLYYKSYLSPYSGAGGQGQEVSFYDEYRKAALLAGHNNQIFYEVGKILLSQWPELPDKDREFTIEILKKIAKRKDKAQFEALMYVWEMNVKDYVVMERVLPEDAQICRMYAKFLGEKSLSLEERQKVLARVEFQEFERAREAYGSGERDFMYLRVRSAFKHYKFCLDILERIKFYQTLGGPKLIYLSEFDRLQKSACLKLAKCRLEEGRGLSEVEGYLRRYLELEDRMAALGELESYLRRRGVIDAELGANLDDLERLSFQIFLYFKQNRYRDIMRVGGLLQQSFVVVPEAKRRDYVEVLQLVGDAYQKVDYLYDAADFYQKALEVDPESLESLLGLRQNYERLNEDKEIREINERIDKILSSEEASLENPLIGKGQRFSRVLTLDGNKMTLELRFENGGGAARELEVEAEGEVEEAAGRAEREEVAGEVGRDVKAEAEVDAGEAEGEKAVRRAIAKAFTPLISVYFNSSIVWEDYLKDDTISISLDTEVGENKLVIVPVNMPVRLKFVRRKM